MEYANWLGLLKWSLAQGSDGTAPSQFTPMSEDDKKWLEQVMREAIKDEPKRMNEIMGEFVKMLENGLTEAQSDQVLDLLDELRFMIEQVDMAQVFAKFGGFQCLLGLVECETITAEARALAASTLAALTQNNLVVQDRALQDGILDRLAKVYVQSESVVVCNKVLYALSCSIRNHQAAEEYFMLHFAEKVIPKAISGLTSLAALSESPAAEGLVSRALFLCNALVISDYSSPARVDKIKSLVLPLCLTGLESESVDLKETTQNLVAALQCSPSNDIHSAHCTSVALNSASHLPSSRAQRKWLQGHPSTAAQNIGILGKFVGNPGTGEQPLFRLHLALAVNIFAMLTADDQATFAPTAPLPSSHPNSRKRKLAPTFPGQVKNFEQFRTTWPAIRIEKKTLQLSTWRNRDAQNRLKDWMSEELAPRIAELSTVILSENANVRTLYPYVLSSLLPAVQIARLIVKPNITSASDSEALAQYVVERSREASLVPEKCENESNDEETGENSSTIDLTNPDHVRRMVFLMGQSRECTGVTATVEIMVENPQTKTIRGVVRVKKTLHGDDDEGFYQLCDKLAIVREANGGGAVFGALTNFEKWIFASIDEDGILRSSITGRLVDELVVLEENTTALTFSSGAVFTQAHIFQLVGIAETVDLKNSGKEVKAGTCKATEYMRVGLRVV